MDVVYRRCCGIDVHKETVAACVLRWEEGGQVRKEKKVFGTMTRSLHELAAWLSQHEVTHVAMEATGVYWEPVWNVLEGQFQLLLINPEHYKGLRGKKTDLKDGERIGELLQHGLLSGSFVPPCEIRALRGLTRHRASLAQERVRVFSRIQKLLEDANIKLASVASDVLGLSGAAMLDAIAAGQDDPKKLAEMARGKLRAKLPALRLALEGRVQAHHRFLLRELLDHELHLQFQLGKIDEEIARRAVPYEETVARWKTIPGVDQITAWSLLAEIGTNMDQFPSPQQLASWAGVCPGNNESAGKRKSGKTRKGSPWLRRVLCQAAWAASHTKGTYLAAQFRRFAAKRGKKRAIIAVAHSILVIAYHMLKNTCDYQELGGDYFDRINSEGLKRYLVKRLEHLGYKVQLDAQPQPGSTACT